MNPTRQALEAFLADHPNDMAAHAAYADWLIEHDDSRGEYIRGYVALQDHALSTEQRNQQARALEEYAKAHETEWLGPLLEYVKPNWRPLEIRAARTSTEHVVASLYQGWIQELFLVFPEPRIWNAVEMSPMVRLIRTLFVSSDSEPYTIDFSELLRPLLRMSGLRRLVVNSRQIGDLEVDRFLASGIVARLYELQFQYCSITDDGARALAADPHVRKLKLLDLSGNLISPIGREALSTIGFVIGRQSGLAPGRERPFS